MVGREDEKLSVPLALIFFSNKMGASPRSSSAEFFATCKICPAVLCETNIYLPVTNAEHGYNNYYTPNNRQRNNYLHGFLGGFFCKKNELTSIITEIKFEKIKEHPYIFAWDRCVLKLVKTTRKNKSNVL